MHKNYRFALRAGEDYPKYRIINLRGHSKIFKRRLDERVWTGIDQTVQRGSGHAYDLALQAVKDLAEAMAQVGREAEFQNGLVKLLSVHGKRGA